MTISEITPASFADDGFALGFTQDVTRTVHAGSYVAALVTQGWAGGAVQTLTMSDDKGGTWSVALDVLTSSGHQQLAAQFYRTTPFSTSDFGGSASDSVTFTLTSTDNGGAKGLCIREIAGSSGVDTHTGALQDTPPTSTDGASSGTLTPSSQPLLLLGTCIDVPGNQDPSAGTGFTDAGSGFNYGGSPNSTRAESKRLTSTSEVAATFTVGASETLFTHAIVFLEAAEATEMNRAEHASHSRGYDVDISAADFVFPVPVDALFVGGVGTIVLRERGNNVDTTWTTHVADETLPIQVVIVRKVGTTATAMKGLR